MTAATPRSPDVPQSSVPKASALRRRARDRLGWLAAWAVVTVLMLWPALWNGFPLIYADTGGYLMRPVAGTPSIGRSALYGAFLLAGMPLDFWPVVIVQSAVTAWLIVTVMRLAARTPAAGTPAAGTRPVAAVLVGGALAALTALPWYAAQLMPDVMAGWAVLALVLLAVRPDALRRWETVLLAAVVAVAIAAHMGTLALCIGLLACATFYVIVTRLARRAGALPGLKLGTAAAAVAAGLLLAPLSNLAITGQFAFTPGGANFLFGRLVQDGIVGRYLDEHCPDPAISLCPYREKLPATADEWLWTRASPLYRLGNWQGYGVESARIAAATLRLYPLDHLATAVRATARQLVLFRTTLAVSPADNADALDTFERLLPADALARFRAARQQRQTPDVAPLNLVHVPAAVLALAVVLYGAAGGRGRVPVPTRLLCATVLLALLGNAAVCGIFSNPNDRYQSRLIWLAVLAAGAVAAPGPDGRRQRLGRASRNVNPASSPPAKRTSGTLQRSVSRTTPAP